LAKLQKGHRRIIEGNFKIIYRIEDEVIYITDFSIAGKIHRGWMAENPTLSILNT